MGYVLDGRLSGVTCVPVLDRWMSWSTDWQM